MRSVGIIVICALFLVGCSGGQDSPAAQPTVAPAPPVAATAEQTQQASAAEQALRSLGVPIYAGATVDPLQHSHSDDMGCDAVFTTSDPVSQVVAFYSGNPDLTVTKAGGSNLFHGTINGIPMGIEVRTDKGKTQIIAQARKS